MARPLVAVPAASGPHVGAARVAVDVVLVAIACCFGVTGFVVGEDPWLQQYPTPSSSDRAHAIAVGGFCLVVAVVLVGVVVGRSRRRGNRTLTSIGGAVMVAVGLLGVPPSLLATGYGLVVGGLATFVVCIALVVGGGRLLLSHRATA